MFFGTPHRAKDLLSWEDLVFNIFLATDLSQFMIQDLPSRVRAFAKMLPQITADFNSLRAKDRLVNIYQGDNQDSTSSGVSAVITFSPTGLVPSTLPQ